jgi:hypothetical protein
LRPQHAAAVAVELPAIFAAIVQSSCAGAGADTDPAIFCDAAASSAFDDWRTAPGAGYDANQPPGAITHFHQLVRVSLALPQKAETRQRGGCSAPELELGYDIGLATTSTLSKIAT